MHTDPERTLVEACQVATPATLPGPFQRLHDAYARRVYEVCRRVTGSDADARDASQDVFLTLSRRIGDFRFESRFSSWVHRIAVNASYNTLRSNRRHGSCTLDARSDGGVTEEELGALVEERVPQPSAELLHQEAVEIVRRALDQLSIKLRTVLVLRYMEDMSYGQIGRELGVAEGTVKSRLFRAHRALRLELEPLLRSA